MEEHLRPIELSLVRHLGSSCIIREATTTLQEHQPTVVSDQEREGGSGGGDVGSDVA
jgi:hypothetical protein